ncbi:hypothetical protein TWF106_010409 [Orbilia oligospora]|uniref:Uncharacterized protein n=1 Tax=Orbilia oligospora TaxID=2813651 RepID=A0A7C8QFC3_ORBOL|nr:hypothetical protein TWF106_010409 [Orbilia oligospora]
MGHKIGAKVPGPGKLAYEAAGSGSWEGRGKRAGSSHLTGSKFYDWTNNNREEKLLKAEGVRGRVESRRRAETNEKSKGKFDADQGRRDMIGGEAM